MTMSRCSAFIDQPRPTSSAASQSSSSGWLGFCPIAPKSSVVLTIPSPKWCFQRRLTSTRASGGWPPDRPSVAPARVAHWRRRESTNPSRPGLPGTGAERGPPGFYDCLECGYARPRRFHRRSPGPRWVRGAECQEHAQGDGRRQPIGERDTSSPLQIGDHGGEVDRGRGAPPAPFATLVCERTGAGRFDIRISSTAICPSPSSIRALAPSKSTVPPSLISR